MGPCHLHIQPNYFLGSKGQSNNIYDTVNQEQNEGIESLQMKWPTTTIKSVSERRIEGKALKVKWTDSLSISSTTLRLLLFGASSRVKGSLFLS